MADNETQTGDQPPRNANGARVINRQPRRTGNGVSVYDKEQQRFIDRYVDMLWEDPDNARLIGRGTRFASKAVLRQWLLDHNPDSAWLGRPCPTDAVERGRLLTGHTLTVPAGFDFDEVIREVACRPRTTITRRPTENPTPPAENREPEPQRGPLMAQYADEPGDMRQFGAGIMMYNGFYGRPPRDGRAVGPMNAGRVVDGAIVPNDSEGTYVAGGDGRPGGRPRDSRIYAGRARFRELTFGPEASYVMVRNADGSINYVPNRRYNQKGEQNFGQIMDNDQAADFLRGNGMVRFERSMNADYVSPFSNSNTASNRNDSMWVRSGDALKVRTFNIGLEDAYKETRDRLMGGTVTAQDANNFLDLAIRARMEPIQWSVASDVARRSSDQLRGEVTAFMASPGFNSLSEAEKTAFRERAARVMPAFENPDDLLAAVGGREQLRGLYNPFRALAHARAQDPYIRDHYWSGLGARDSDRPAGMDRNTWRSQQAELVLLAYAEELETAGQRVPYRTERASGTGVLYNRPNQTVDAINAERNRTFTAIRGSQENLEAFGDIAFNTPGNGQRISDILFMASRSGRGLLARVGNSRGAPLLGFRGDRETDAFVRGIAADLAGPEYANRVDYRGNSLINGVINGFPLFLGAPNLGANRNQNRGTADGFEEAMRAQWNDPDPVKRAANRERMNAAMQRLIDRGLIADGNGYHMALASLTSIGDPIRAERYGTYDTPSYQRLRGISNVWDNSRAQAENVQNMTPAAIEATLERLVASGVNFQTGDEEAIRAAIARGDRTVALRSGQTVNIPDPNAQPPANGQGGNSRPGRIPPFDSSLPGMPDSEGRGAGGNAQGGNTTGSNTTDPNAAALAAAGPARVAGVGVWNVDSARAIGSDPTLDAGQRASRLGVVLSTNDNPTRGSQEQTDRQIVRSAFATDPVSASVLALSAGARLPDDSPQLRALATIINNVDQGNGPLRGGAQARTGDALRAGLQELRANANNPEAFRAAQARLYSQLTAISTGPDAEGFRNGANLLAGELSTNGPLSGLFNREFAALASHAQDNGGLNTAQRRDLNNRLATATTPDARAAVVRDFANSLRSGGGANTGAAPLNAEQLRAVETLLTSGLPENQLRAGLASVLAGNADLNAINAGGTALNALNAGQRSAYNALLAANPNADQLRSGIATILSGDLNAFNNGTVNLNALNANAANSLNAGQQSSLNALVSLNAAVGSAINAGSTNSLNAGSQNQLNSFLSLRDGTTGQFNARELDARLTQLNAGFGDQVGTFNARWSLDIYKIIETVAIGACVAALCPGGGDNSFIPRDCPVCGPKPRPIPNVIPGLPGAPGRPGVG